MLNIVGVTLRGVFRDRVFRGILMVALAMPLIPLVSSLSMRQVTELSITLTLSTLSFFMLLLAVFLGGVSLWKDVEKRYIFSVLSLPLNRGTYLLGKFVGLALFLVLTASILGVIAFMVVWVVTGNNPPDRPVAWNNFALAIIYDALKYILLVAVALLLSTVSTSFFLPIFGTISAFLVGNASQEVYDYVNSQAGEVLPILVRKCASGLYYVIPNFSAFDLKVNAIYGLPLSGNGLILTFLYFVIYTAVLLVLASIVYSWRELK